MNPDVWDDVYGPGARVQIESRVSMMKGCVSAQSLVEHPELLAEVDVLMSSWGGPRLDETLLAAAPKLQAVFYAAGSVRPIVTPALWARGIVVVSAWRAIAARVAEYASALIVLALKDMWRYAGDLQTTREWGHRWDIAGTVGATVGIVGLGAVGQDLCRRLQHSDLRVVAYDPYVDHAIASRLGAEMVALPQLFGTADVISLHVPLLPQTRKMIDGGLLSAMKPGSTLINTARGGLVDHTALADVLTDRSDLFAFLDVTDPEPPPADWPLLSMENVVVTPHIAGNVGLERRALRRLVAAELGRFIANEQLHHAVDPTEYVNSA